MTQAVLLDTDCLSDIFENRYPGVVKNTASYLAIHPNFIVSSLTVMEVLKGLMTKGAAQKLKRFKNAMATGLEVISFDTPQAEIAAEIFSALQKAGQPIGPTDPLIAATAISENLPLVTSNTRHYARIANLGFPLVLQNWRES